MRRNDLAFIGHMCFDEVEPYQGKAEVRPGSAVLCGAMAAARVGKRVGVITRMRREDDAILEPMRALGIDCTLIPTSDTTYMYVAHHTVDVDHREIVQQRSAGFFHPEEIPELDTWGVHLEGITAHDGFSGTYLYGVFEDEPVNNYWQRVGLVKTSGLFVNAPNWSRMTVAIATSGETPHGEVAGRALTLLEAAADLGHEGLRAEQATAWAHFWETRTLRIEGDPASQQGVNFCYFSLRQIYSGKDHQMNFVPKAVGENYGGHYFWDSEGTVLPCYLWFDQQTAREILMFRYNTLDFARRKASQLRMPGAQYPWYTINGQEDSRNGEIHLFEIHNNAVFIWAIQRYVDFTGDEKFLAEFGLEIMIELARFWTARVTFSERRGHKYLVNGVVGPDECHMMVNNDCFTNGIVAHAMGVAAAAVARVSARFPAQFAALSARIGFTIGEPIELEFCGRTVQLKQGQPVTGPTMAPAPACAKGASS